MKCINLKERFGKKWRVKKEIKTNSPDSWNFVMPCKLGHICPWGGTVLAACIDKHPLIIKRVSKLPFMTLHQHGNDGANLLFDVEHFDKVIKFMKPYKRRKLSEEQKAESVERLKQYGLKKKLAHDAHH